MDAEHVHLSDRIRHLTRVMEDVSGERDLAMFKAYQHGLTYQEIAKLAMIDLATARHTIEVLSREDDIEDWGDDEPIWVVAHPRNW